MILRKCPFSSKTSISANSNDSYSSQDSYMEDSAAHLAHDFKDNRQGLVNYIEKKFLYY